MTSPIRALETFQQRIASTAAKFEIGGIDMRPLDRAIKTPTLFGDTLVIPNTQVTEGVEIQSLARASTLERYAQFGRNVARFMSTNWTNTPSYENIARIEQNGTFIHGSIAATDNLEEQGAIESEENISFDDAEGKAKLEQKLSDLTAGGLTPVVERVVEKDGHLRTQIIGTLWRAKSRDGRQSSLISVVEVYDPGMMNKALQSSSRFLAEGVMVLSETKSLDQKSENVEHEEAKPEKWFSYEETLAPVLREISPAGINKVVHIIKYDDPKLLNPTTIKVEPDAQMGNPALSSIPPVPVQPQELNDQPESLTPPADTQPNPAELPKVEAVTNGDSLNQWVMAGPIQIGTLDPVRNN